MAKNNTFKSEEEIKDFNFKDIQNFFGDRGIIVNQGDFIKWANDDRYIYWIPNNKKCDESLQSTNEKSVLWTSLKNMYVEIEDEILLKNIQFELKWNN